MILTQKLSMIAFGLYDSTHAIVSMAYQKVHKQAKLSPDFEKRALSAVPSPLEFFGHCFFFAGFLAGPTHHFNQYKAVIEGLFDLIVGCMYIAKLLRHSVPGRQVRICLVCEHKQVLHIILLHVIELYSWRCIPILC